MENLRKKYFGKFEEIFSSYEEECRNELNRAKNKNDEIVIELLNMNEELEDRIKKLYLENDRIDKIRVEKNNMISILEKELREKKQEIDDLEKQVEKYIEELKKYKEPLVEKNVKIEKKNEVSKVKEQNERDKNIKEQENRVTEEDIKKLLEAMQSGGIKEKSGKKEELHRELLKKIDTIFLKCSRENVSENDIRDLKKDIKIILSYEESTFNQLIDKEINSIGILSIIVGVFDEFKQKCMHINRNLKYDVLDKFNMIFKSECSISKGEIRKEVTIEYFQKNVEKCNLIEEEMEVIIKNLLGKVCKEVGKRVIYVTEEIFKCKNEKNKLIESGVFIKCEDKNGEEVYVYSYWGGYCLECKSVYISEEKLHWLSKNYKGVKIEVPKDNITKAIENYNKGNLVLAKKYIDEIYFKDIKIKKKEKYENIIWISSIIYVNEYNRIIELIDRFEKDLNEKNKYKEKLKAIYLGENKKSLYKYINGLTISEKLKDDIRSLFRTKKELKEKREMEGKKIPQKKLIAYEKQQREVISKMNDKAFKEKGIKLDKISNESLDVMELKQESDIKKLGYSTLLSDVQRRKILREKAIPRIGKAKVISHLKWLVKMNKGRKVMQNAVAIWESDIRVLEKK